MIDQIFILAGGNNNRWRGIKKFYLPVNGEPVLARTIRLVNEIRPDALVKVVYDHLGDSHMEAFNMLYDDWSEDGWTYLMFGDVSWMRGTLRKFLRCEPGIPIFFGRPHGNVLTGRPAKEIFGGIIPQHYNSLMYDVQELAVKLTPQGDWWTVAELMLLPYYIRPFLPPIPRPIRDFIWFHFLRSRKKFLQSSYFYDVGESVTDDFDYPEDYGPYVEKCGPFIEREVAP